MSKIYVACRDSAGDFDIIAAFENEGDALESADSHKVEGRTSTWVEEVNYYEHE